MAERIVHISSNSVFLRFFQKEFPPNLVSLGLEYLGYVTKPDNPLKAVPKRQMEDQVFGDHGQSLDALNSHWTRIHYHLFSADLHRCLESDGRRNVLVDVNDESPEMSPLSRGLFYKPEFRGVSPWHWSGPTRRPFYLQPLGPNNLLYKIVLSGDWSKESLSKYQVIFLADLEAMSDELCHALDEFEKNGGTVVATGRSRVYDEFGRKRPDMVDKRPETTPEEDYREKLGSDIIQKIRQASDPQYVEVDGEPWVVVNLVRKTNGSAYILHVINYEPGSCCQVNIRLNIPNRTFDKATLFSPDQSPSKKSVPISDGVSITLDRINVYSIIRLV